MHSIYKLYREFFNIISSIFPYIFLLASILETSEYQQYCWYTSILKY